MDALIKPLRGGKPSEVKSNDAKSSGATSSFGAKSSEFRPAELDPSEFLAAAVQPDQARPSRHEAETAVKTLLSYIGENPDREGLLDTPRRVVEAYGTDLSGLSSVPGRGAQPNVRRDRRP